MNPNLAPIKALIDLVAAAVKATEAAVQPGQSALQRILDFEGLIPQLVAFLPQLSQVSLSGLQPSDYIALGEYLVSDLAIENAKAKAIIDASFKVVTDLVAALPDVEALVASFSAPAAAAPAAPAAPSA